MNIGIAHALLAALLFGASTPFAKLLVGDTPPLLLAGLLYAGSGIRLSAWLALRRLLAPDGDKNGSIALADLPWLAGAVFSGGIVGPVLLMTGLSLASASTSSLLLNMEGVLTALLAWFVFREQFDRRIFLGMLFIIAAGVLLSLDSGATTGGRISWGALCIVAACLCWAIDNNLTRKVAASDAVQIAAVKGLTAGAVNLAFAFAWLEVPVPDASLVTMAGLVSFCGYGLSLVLFVLALRHLGTARTGAYFSAAPFVGAAISLAMLGERPDPVFWVAAGMMSLGIWLHLTESHDHMHTHEHVPLTHAHPHFPDIHHRHRH